MKNNQKYFESVLTDEYSVRKGKVNQLNSMNISSWPNHFSVHKNYIVNVLEKNIHEDNAKNVYTVLGRVTNIREHGKSIFMHIQDATGNIQLYIKKEDGNSDLFNFILKFFDVGDVVECVGIMFITKTQEKTLRINQAKILSKCLRNVPDKYVGFDNIEERYRKRYLDIIVNHEVRDIFIKRTLLIRHIRNFLDQCGYLEVETPMLHQIPGGALAKPFKTYHNALNTDLFLRIAPELYLKKLIIAGFEKVYEINKNFRNEGVSIRHNPEFTMLEFYTAYQNYEWAMKMVEEILRSVCFILNNTYAVSWNDYEINFEDSFDRLSAYQALLKYSHLTDAMLQEDVINKLIDDIEMHKKSYAEKIFYLFEQYAEHKIIKPTFLIDFPVSNSPLAKVSDDNPDIACRFELFICGMEISNGYNELNNPFDQSDRFQSQARERDNNGNEEAMYYDADFITALEYGMPPTVGVGIGIDRVCMLLTGAKTIKDVILFPTMKKNL